MYLILEEDVSILMSYGEDNSDIWLGLKKEEVSSGLCCGVLSVDISPLRTPGSGQTAGRCCSLTGAVRPTRAAPSWTTTATSGTPPSARRATGMSASGTILPSPPRLLLETVLGRTGRILEDNTVTTLVEPMMW